MKNANEMLQIVIRKIEYHLGNAERCNKKYIETGRESWYERYQSESEKAEMYNQLHYEFTGKYYEPDVE